MNVAIIPAKGHSTRIPNKNRKTFHGRPILAYSISAAKSSGLFKRVIVSTDDGGIWDLAHDLGADAVYRPNELTRDEIGTQEVAAYHLEMLGRRERPEYACCIYATAPMLQPWDLMAGFALLPANLYAYVPGIYYWGHTEAFLGNLSLSAGVLVPYPETRYIDINTPEDWSRAEQMYSDMRKATA